MNIKYLLLTAALLASAASFAQKPPKPVETDGEGVVNPFANGGSAEACSDKFNFSAELTSSTEPFSFINSTLASSLTFHNSLSNFGVPTGAGFNAITTTATYKVRNLNKVRTCSDVIFDVHSTAYAYLKDGDKTFPASSSSPVPGTTMSCKATTIFGSSTSCKVSGQVINQYSYVNAWLGKMLPYTNYYIAKTMSLPVPISPLLNNMGVDTGVSVWTSNNYRKHLLTYSNQHYLLK